MSQLFKLCTPLHIYDILVFLNYLSNVKYVDTSYNESKREIHNGMYFGKKNKNYFNMSCKTGMLGQPKL